MKYQSDFFDKLFYNCATCPMKSTYESFDFSRFEGKEFFDIVEQAILIDAFYRIPKAWALVPPENVGKVKELLEFLDTDYTEEELNTLEIPNYFRVVRYQLQLPH